MLVNKEKNSFGKRSIRKWRCCEIGEGYLKYGGGRNASLATRGWRALEFFTYGLCGKLYFNSPSRRSCLCVALDDNPSPGARSFLFKAVYKMTRLLWAIWWDAEEEQKVEMGSTESQGLEGKEEQGRDIPMEVDIFLLLVYDVCSSRSIRAVPAK